MKKQVKSLQNQETESGIPAREWYHPQWAGLPTSIHLNKLILHRHVQEPVSQGDPRVFRVDS